MDKLLRSLLFVACTAGLTGCELYRKQMGFDGTPEPAIPVVPVVTPLTPVTPVTPVTSTATVVVAVPISHKVFIVDGQSNARGNHQGIIPPPYPHVVHPIGGGPGYGFGVSYVSAHPNEYVRTINCAVGGTSIAVHQEGGTLFETCIGNVAEQMQPGDTLEGIIWWQGETDGWNGMDGATWSNYFRTYISAMRRRLNKPELPVVYVQLGMLISPYNGSTYPAPTWDAIKDAQATFFDPHAAMVKSEDLVLSDHVHYTTDSHAIVGDRLYRAFERLR
jgi:hypothetical protein